MTTTSPHPPNSAELPATTYQSATTHALRYCPLGHPLRLAPSLRPLSVSRGDEASGVLGECLLAYLAAECVGDAAPRGLGCHIVGVKAQNAYRVGLTAGAFWAAAQYLDKTERIGNSLESSGRQRGEVGVAEDAGGVAELLCDQKLPCSTGARHPCREIDCAADVITLAVEDTAVVCTDVERRELGLSVDESVHREAEFDGVRGLSEHQHERIPDLLENPARMLDCGVTHGDAESLQHIGGRLITHHRGQRSKARQVDEQHGRPFLPWYRRGWRGLFGEMAQQILAVGSLIRPAVKMQNGRLDEFQQGFPDALGGRQQLATNQSLRAET